MSATCAAARTVNELVRACTAGERPELLHFWGHTARGSGPGPFVLSQWYPCPFEGDRGEIFRSAEHYMMWRKAILFEDGRTAAQVLAATTPAAAKALGRRVADLGADTRVSHR